MNNIIRFGLCVAVNFLGVVEGLLVVFHVLTTGVKRLFEKGAKVLVVFFVLFGAMYLIALQFNNGNLFSKTWQNYITIIVIAVLVCAIFLIRSIGETLLLLIAEAVGLVIPTPLITKTNMVTEKLADKYVLLGDGSPSENKYIFAVHTVLYWAAQILRLPLHILSIVVPLGIGGYWGYRIGFVWSEPPAKMSPEWFFCVGVILLCAGIGLYIGHIFSTTLKMYYAPKGETGEDS